MSASGIIVTESFKNDLKKILPVLYKELKEYISRERKALLKEDSSFNFSNISNRWSIDESFQVHPDMKWVRLSFRFDGDNRNLAISFNCPDKYEPYDKTSCESFVVISTFAGGRISKVQEIILNALSQVTKNDIFYNPSDYTDNWKKYSIQNTKLKKSLFL